MSWDWDEATLSGFLEARGLADGPPAPRRIGDGHSNLTYLIRVKGGQAVLRRPPPPPLPKGANDVLREARVMAALEGQGVPVPQVHAVAQAGEVLDVPFYIMAHVPGHVITDRLPAGFDSARDLPAMGRALAEGLARLHAVDWQACGLADFGRPEGFNRRHLERLEGLMRLRDGDPPGWLSDMADALKADVPPEAGAAIVHNDYRLGNVIWSDAPGPRLAAILDWELATLGDPLLDLGYLVCCHPAKEEAMTPTQELSAAFRGAVAPSRAALCDWYADASGRDLSRLGWYAAMAAWKLAVLYDYQHRQGRDAYYADPGQARRFVTAAERFAAKGV